MAQQVIDVGTSASDGTGDPLREAFTKINENFTELYSGNVQVAAANVLVYSVAGRTGNVVLTVNDVAQAASKSYVDSAISANLSPLTAADSALNANITAANLVISDHSSRLTTLESNAASQALQINSLVSVKANVTYVEFLVDQALSSNAILANVAETNASLNTKANLTGAVFSGNITAPYVFANSRVETGSYIITGSEFNDGQAWSSPAALMFGDSPGYHQLNLKNINSLGSGDIVVTADDGSDGSNYIVMGVAGSNYFDPIYPWTLAHDGYLYVIGGNLLLEAATNSIKMLTSNITRIEVTSTGSIKLQTGTVLEFPDGTLQTTAFGGNANITAINNSIVSLNANITAANLSILSLQSNAVAQALDIDSLWSNAGVQGGSILSLQSNAATQATLINLINANVSAANSNAASQSVAIDTLIANAATQASLLSALSANAAIQTLELDSLISNAAAQGAAIDSLTTNAAAQATSLNNLISNAATQSAQIDLLNSNVTAANLNITSLQSNAATQAVSINNLTANAASQALDIDNIYANLTGYLSNVQISFDIATVTNATLANISANLGTVTNDIANLTANASSQSSLIDNTNANVTAANASIDTKAAIAGQTFTGNITAPYIHANVDLVANSSIRVGQASPVIYPDAAGTFVGNVDGRYQLVVQNLSSNSGASGDIVISNNDGNNTTNYFNIGLYSSNWSGNFTGSFGDTNLTEFAYDGHATVIGGNLVMRSDYGVFLVANTAATVLNQDGNFTLIRSNLQFYDNTVQTTAIQDVPGLYANIGVAYDNIQVLDANLGVASTQLSNIGNLSYTPANVANWNGTISTIQDALDELAARLKALGG